MDNSVITVMVYRTLWFISLVCINIVVVANHENSHAHKSEMLTYNNFTIEKMLTCDNFTTQEITKMLTCDNFTTQQNAKTSTYNNFTMTFCNTFQISLFCWLTLLAYTFFGANYAESIVNGNTEKLTCDNFTTQKTSTYDNFTTQKTPKKLTCDNFTTQYFRGAKVSSWLATFGTIALLVAATLGVS